MYKKSLHALWIMLIFCLSPSVAAQDQIILRSDDLVIAYEKSLESLARDFHANYPRVREDLQTAIGWRLKARPTLLLVADRESFNKMSGSPFVGAFAVPRRHIIVIHYDAGRATPYSLEETFKHELCHLLLHDHIKESLLPKWLDEGTCQWVSGSLGEVLAGGREDAAAALDLSHHAIPLERLARNFPEDRRFMFLAYRESREFVEYITARYGKDGFLDILNALKDGNTIDEAFVRILSVPLEMVEQEWLEHIRNRNVWFIWVSRYLYEILFFLTALLTVAAFFRLMVRKKRRYADEDEDEDGE